MKNLVMKSAFVVLLTGIAAESTPGQQIVSYTTPPEISWGGPAEYRALISKVNTIIVAGQPQEQLAYVGTAEYLDVDIVWTPNPFNPFAPPIPVFMYTDTQLYVVGAGRFRYDVRRGPEGNDVQVNVFDVAF